MTTEQRQKMVNMIHANNRWLDRQRNSEKLLNEFYEKWSGNCMANMPQPFKKSFADLLQRIDTVINS